MRRAFGLLVVGVCYAWAGAPQESAADAELTKAVEEFKIVTRELGLRPDSPRKQAQAGPRWKWHGRIFENLRNDVLDAVPHEITQGGTSKSLLRRNQYGFNIGGPLEIPFLYSGRQATHFSLSFEGVRERVSRSYLRTIPTTPERTGDFSKVVDSSGEPLPVYDPLTTQLNPEYNPSQDVSTENLQYSRSQFPGNKIPASRLDPVALKALSYYPIANTSIGPYDQNNYFHVSPETNKATGMIVKVDHSIRERHRLNFEVAYTNGFLGPAEIYPGVANPGGVDHTYQNRRGSFEHVLTLSAQTVNTFGFDAQTEMSNNGKESDTDYPADLGLSGVSGGVFPYMVVQPYVSLGRPNSVLTNARNTFSWWDSFSTRKGKHNLRMSVRYTRFQVNSRWLKYPTGYFLFGSGLTSLPGIVNTGRGFASFLLGESQQSVRTVNSFPSYFRTSGTWIWVGDSWEPRQGLNISIGTNTTVFTPRTEKYNHLSTVDLTAINPANNRPGAMVVAGLGGYGRTFQPILVKTGPNVSFAWSPRGNPKTVIRANFGRDYGSIPLYSGQFGTQAFNGTLTYTSPNTQLEPAVVLSNGVPVPAQSWPDYRLVAANDYDCGPINRTDTQPGYQSGSLALERQLPAAILLSGGLSYAGGKNLTVDENIANPNAIRLEALQYRDSLNDEEFRSSLRPYPQYKGFDLSSSWPIGRYRRDAAWLRVEKRTGRGLALNLNYTLSKQYDDYSGPTGRQDVYNRNNEWSLVTYNRPHYFSMNYVYELPFGRSVSDWRRYFVVGWSVSGTSSVASGLPLWIMPLFNNTGGVVTALRVNVVPGVDPHVEIQALSLFNPSAFENPDDFTIGNASRTHSSLRGPISQGHDLSLNKLFSLGAERSVELSAVGLNFMNHANWNSPDTTIGTADSPNTNAGKITGSSGGRVIQLGLRFNF